MRATALLLWPCISLAAAAAPCACAYDWTVDRGAPDLDASSDVVTQPDVNGTDAPSVGDAGPPDVVVDTGPLDTGAPPADGAMPPSCAQLAHTLEQAQAAAVSCVVVGHMCTLVGTDACGCQVWVVQADAGAVTSFTSALSAFESSGCSPSAVAGLCAPSCPATTQASLCIAADAGASFACFQ